MGVPGGDAVRNTHKQRMSMRKILIQVTGLLCSAGLFVLGYWNTTGQPAIARSEISWPGISLSKVVSGLTLPLHVTHAGDDSGRLFIVEQAGIIRIFKNGALLDNPFLDISDRVRSPATGGGGEQGLLSVAFPPGYGAGKNYFYVYYTRTDSNNQLSRFYLSSDPNVADPGKEDLILTFPHPTYENHNGGLLTFGPDGYLYIGTGDGGGGGDPYGNAQDPSSLLGKLLRIDVEFTTQPPATGDFQVYLPFIEGSDASHSVSIYAIPPSNPFSGQPGYRGEIWALGLRNPWRYSFDRVTHDLYIADVGQNTYEEVDFQTATSQGGENYGWNIMEGEHCFKPPTGCDKTGLVLPVTEYTHQEGHSITGGFVYRGGSFPALQGIYFFGDFSSGTIWGLQYDETTWVRQTLQANTALRISTFGEDQAGELYLANYSAGEIYQIVSP
jgi:glucose/arabinose dehydrogenase